MDPTARVAWSSVRAAQLFPPLVDRHTPPWALPTKMVFGSSGEIAIAVTRPLLGLLGEVAPSVIGAGPMGVQLAGSTARYLGPVRVQKKSTCFPIPEKQVHLWQLTFRQLGGHGFETLGP